MGAEIPGSMKLGVSHVLLAVASVTLIVGGFTLGRLTAPQARDPENSPGRLKKVFDPDGDAIVASKANEVGGGDVADKGFSEQRLQQASALANPRLRERGMEEALAHANLDEVKQALRWADSLPDGPSKKTAMADILERWAQMDGAGATDYASQMYEATGNAGPLREALQGWAQSDPSGALQKLESLGLTDGLKADIRTDLVAQWTEQNPQGAATFAAGNRDTSSWRGLVATVANEWSKEDPKTAATWAASLSTGLDQTHALSAAISNWFQANPVEAGAYVNSQPPGQSRDAMALTMARQTGQENPSAGLQWAATVGDPKAQEKAAAGALYELYQKDPQQALKALGTSQLSKTMQELVATRLQNPGPWWR